VHGLDLLEALLDGGLPLVGLEDLGRGEAAIVTEQRVLRRVPDHAASGLVRLGHTTGCFLLVSGARGMIMVC
jgi:hypothetical protein